jgi:hypothetical protein
MDGLIDQAKTQLWKVVNTFIDARRDGAAPFVEVALFEYGNNIFPSEVITSARSSRSPATSMKSAAAFRARPMAATNTAARSSSAHPRRPHLGPSPRTYKAVFIAGNEPFTQGPVEPRGACREAFSKGIIVNTIHCGRAMRASPDRGTTAPLSAAGNS